MKHKNLHLRSTTYILLEQIAQSMAMTPEEVVTLFIRDYCVSNAIHISRVFFPPSEQGGEHTSEKPDV